MLSIDHLYTYSDYLTIEFYVKVNGNSGSNTFCVWKESLINFLDELELLTIGQMNKSLLSDTDSDGYITFELNDSKK